METLIEIKNLKTYFPVKKGLFLKTVGFVKAVDNVSFNISKGESFGLVGESGSGKTTLGRTILNLIKPISGEVLYKGENIFKIDRRKNLLIRKKMQIVFQNPFSSLNPRKTIGAMLIEPIIFHKIMNRDKAKEEVFRLLEKVGLSRDAFYRYPHEFSGGQRQRIGIARALTVKPEFIVLDEPVSALDVSIQAQILNLLKELQKEFNLTYLFIAHNLNVIRFFSTRVAVMYLGKIMEIGEAEEVFNNPLHPYTKLLLESIPSVEGRGRKEIPLMDEIPSIINLPAGCRFHPRCKFKTQACQKEEPQLKEIKKGHYVRCFL